MQIKSNKHGAQIQQSVITTQQSPEFAQKSNDAALQYDNETAFFEHNEADMYSKSQNAIHIPNENQQLDFAPEVLDFENAQLDLPQNLDITPTVGAVAVDKRAQYIEQLTATQSKIKDAETAKNNNEKARNSLQTQIAKFEKLIPLTNDLTKISDYNAKISGWRHSKKNLANEYKAICNELKDLQTAENQLQRKIQSLDTPIEIGGNNG